MRKFDNKFVHAYEKDAVILNYLLKYKYKEDNSVGFPVTALNKVITKLTENHVSYQVINKNEIVERERFKKNKYDEIFNVALDKTEIERRLFQICNKVSSCSEEEFKVVMKFMEDHFDL